MQEAAPQAPAGGIRAEGCGIQKKVRRIIGDNPGHGAVAADEASFIMGWNTRNGRYPRGEPVTTPVSLSRKRFCPFGALHRDGFDCRFCDRAGRYSFMDMLGHLYRRHGKIIVLPDNAGCHKARDVTGFIESFGGGIIPVYLPPYTPELNPAEGQWRLIRKATANVLYESAKAMKDSVWNMLGGGETRTAKMSAYLS